jgi:hypothetical protein
MFWNQISIHAAMRQGLELLDSMNERSTMRMRSDAPALLGGLLLLPLAFGALAAGEGALVSQLLRASTDQGAAAREAQFAVKADPSGFMVRAGAVILQTDLLDPAPATANQQLSASSEALQPKILALEFFPDAYVEIQVTSESRSTPDTLSINGRVPDSDLSTFSMTLTPESYLMTFSDPHSPYLYRVVGDTDTGVGRVTEYDPRNRPPVIHSPSIIPPQD